MKNSVLLCLSLLMLGASSTLQAAGLNDSVKAQIGTVGVHPGMDPGLYVCANNHLHIKGTVQNLADVSVGQIKLAGKAFGADGKLLGEASTSIKQATLAAGGNAEFNLEFLTVTGPLIEQVKKHEVNVIDVAPIKKQPR